MNKASQGACNLDIPSKETGSEEACYPCFLGPLPPWPCQLQLVTGRQDCWNLAAQNSHRKIAVTAVAASGLVTILRTGKGVITKGVSSLEKSLESLKSLNSLNFLEDGRNLLSFPQFGGSLETLESLNSLEPLENGLF